MKEQLIFDPSITGFKDEHDRVGAHLVNASGDVLTTGDGDSDDVANTFKALDTRAFAFGYDSAGDNWDRLRSTAGALHVDIQDTEINVDNNFEHDEDAGHTSGHTGAFTLSVRVDDIDGVNTAWLAGTEGDYQAYLTDAKGQLWTHDKDANTSLSALVVDMAAIEVELLDQGTVLDTVSTSLTTINTSLGTIDSNLTDGIDVRLEDGSGNDINSYNSGLEIADVIRTLANSARTDVGATLAVDIKSTAALSDRKIAWMYNNSKKKMFVGATGITSSTGFPMPPGSMYEFKLAAAAAMKVIGTDVGDSQDFRLMEGAA